MKTQTLDQERARYAWDCVTKGMEKEYPNLAKGAPALIMNNGLMQALAFLQNKSGSAKKAAQNLTSHICNWVASLQNREEGDFTSVMSLLVQSDPDFYLRATEEALEVLRWIRQFAAAVAKEE